MAFLRRGDRIEPGLAPGAREPAVGASAALGAPLAGAKTLKVRRSELEQAAAILRRGDSGLARLVGVAAGGASRSSPMVEAVVAFASAARQPVYARAAGADPADRVDTGARRRGLAAVETLLAGFGGPNQLYRGFVVDSAAVDGAVARMAPEVGAAASRTWERAKEISDMRAFGRKQVYAQRDGPDARSR